MLSKCIELRKKTLQGDILVSDLLREALLLSYELENLSIDGVEGFVKWIEDELNGYSENSDVPSYRKTSSTLQGYNSVKDHWVPIPETDRNKEFHLTYPVSELETLVSLSGKGDLSTEPSYSLKAIVKKRYPHLSNIRLILAPAAINHVCSSIKTKIINWTIQIEKALRAFGGDICNTNDDNKNERFISPVQVYNIGKVEGNFVGSANNSALVQKSNYALKKRNFFKKFLAWIWSIINFIYKLIIPSMHV